MVRYTASARYVDTEMQRYREGACNLQPRKIIACGSCTGARKKRRRRVAAARKEPKSRVSSPSRDSFMTTTTTTSCKCKCSCNINMQPDDDVVVAAAAAEMQMHSTSLLLQLLPQQQQQQSRLQQKQQQVNCTIFNAKVKSGNGKKSLAKFYAGSCHYLLARLENCGTTSPPSHVARLYFSCRYLWPAALLPQRGVFGSSFLLAYADASCQGPKAHGPGKKNKNKSKNENETAVSVC